MMPMVVVQILVYNESKEVIDRLMASLAAVESPRDRWRLVIVNNICEGHDPAEYIRSRWMQDERLPHMILEVQNPNLGFAGGHARALELAKTFAPEFVYLLNADAYVDPLFLTNMVAEALRQPNAAIIQSRIMLAQDPTLLNSRGNALHFLGFGFSLGYQEKPSYSQAPRFPTFYASGAGMLVQTSSLSTIGGLFDHDYFMYHEDLDLSWRARLAGFDVGYAQDSIVFHEYEFTKSIKKFYWMERNRHLTNLTNYRLPTLLLIAPAYVLMELGTFLFAARSGWAKQKMRAWAHLLKPSTWNRIRSRRRRIACLRVATDRNMLSHMAGVIANQEVENPLLTHVVNPLFNLYFHLLKGLVWW